MKINYFKDEKLTENHVDIFYNQKDQELESLIEYLDAEGALYGKCEGEQRRLYLNEIYYVEVVERRCFVYLAEAVYEVETNLRGFLDRYAGTGFVQIGKSVAVNMRRIEKIVPDINMKMHLVMENGEQLVVNRAFKKDFMDYLKQKKEVGA